MKIPDPIKSKGSHRAKLLCLLAGTCVGVTLSSLLLLVFSKRPQWTDGLIWRYEIFEAAPKLSQRIFERRMLSHQLAQDRLVPAGATLLFGDSHLQTLPPSALPKAHNFSIGGESAERLAERLPQFNSLRQASAIVLSGGTNDLLEKKSLESVTLGWSNLLEHMPADARVLCVGIPEPTPPAPLAKRIAQVNQAIQRLCLSRNHMFIPVQPQTGDWLDSRLTADGIHLDRPGQLKLLSKINAGLEGELQ